MTDPDAVHRSPARHTGPRWLGVILGLAAVAVAGWVWLTRFDVLGAGHPAYPVLVSTVGVGGIGLVLWSVRASRGPRQRALGLRIAAAILAAVLVGAVGWLRPFPASDPGRPLAVQVQDDTTSVTLRPSSAPRAGLVFQPGALVDHRAYLPMLARVAERGYLVVVVKQPLGIGFLATGAPAAVRTAHPEVTRWAVGGHSLGGVVASSDAAEPASGVRGLLLWASYPASSLASRSGLLVTSVTGTADGLTTPAKVDASRGLLPAGTRFVPVDGAIHAYFGDYGPQPGDGVPAKARDVAQNEIVAATLDLLGRVAAG